MHASFDHWWAGISLRTKITGVTVLLLTFGLAVAGVGTANVLRGYLFEQADTQLDNVYNDIRGKQLGPSGSQPYLSDAAPYYIRIVDSKGTTQWINVATSETDTGPDLEDLDLDAIADRHDGVNVYSMDHQSQWRVKAYSGQFRTGSDSAPGTLIIGVSVASTDATVGRYAVIFAGFAIAVIALGWALTQLLVTSTFAPLRDVERTAARFAAGDYSQRLGGATPNTEVGRLNRSLNTMLARIDSAFADRARTIEQMRRFVGDASHELRTPLVSLRGYAELYRMGALQKPEDVAQAMDRIEREAIRMGALVGDLLELARLDEARQPTLAPVDLLPLAQDAALDASASNPNRKITVVVPDHTNDRMLTLPTSIPAMPTAVAAGALEGGQPATVTSPIALAGTALARLRRRRGQARTQATGEIAPVLPPPVPLPEVGPIVLAEGDKIRQVITNLMGNAMRFTADDGPIELVVDVDAVGGYGSISIVDHGEGIPPQLREKIFQRFWRADSSRTRDTGGSGLGLAIVAGIVANHHGHVEVLETPGGGATFRVSLPLLPRDADDEKSTDAPSEPEGGPAGS
ncbi:cell wall metabolism sensor histidine kinase WalK [Schumannella sp. 10F1B-5-1]|uniref:sensor histidine kinase n=1 Tax=Schumannella sp. 10F1B-5-1 TaxID=2590780 RepID=UPI001131EB8F|nr:HAMP domain-containing sensor histidine kinase [Schumannella sp. 10F1B-5-1]TPW73212.1 HAMP domain-containing histidine kinase [Schumannella sp. 10F1B-5-1]